MEKHKRPANCPELKPTRVNPEIWGQLHSKQRKADLKLANFQQFVRKTTTVNLQTTDWLANNTQNNTDLIKKSVDSLAMLGHLNTQLAQLRRDQIQPTLRPEYKSICAIEVLANSQYVFGDDIAKQLKDVKEASKISCSVTNPPNKKLPKGNYRLSGQDRGGFSDYRNKSRNRNFFYGKASLNRSGTRTTGPKDRQQIIERLKDIRNSSCLLCYPIYRTPVPILALAA